MTQANTIAVTVERSPVWMAQAFLLSLMIPIQISMGPFLLTPHRLFLLVMFVPLFVRLYVTRRAGPVIVVDWLFLVFIFWTAVSLIVNHPLGEAIEPFGIHAVEFLGAYMLARIAIRSSADFRRVIWMLFLLVVFLLPFAVVESFTRRAVLLELIPGTTVPPVDAGIRLGLRRAQTIFVHPILFGVFVSTGFGLFWFALRPRWLRFFAAPAVAAATLFSLSAGALLSLVVQSGFIGWEMIMKTLRRRWALFLTLSILGYIVIDLLSNRTPFHVLVTYGTFYQGSAYARINIWNFGIENVWANPVFGLGLREWVRPVWIADSVDNFWLLNTMRYGLPGIALILWALFVILRRLSLVRLVTEADRQARAAYLVVFGGLFVAGGTVHYWHAMLAFVMFIYGSGLWAVTGGGESEVSAAEPDPAEPGRLSRYTRQTAPGVPIRPLVAGPAQISRGARDTTPRAVPLSRPSRQRS